MKRRITATAAAACALFFAAGTVGAQSVSEQPASDEQQTMQLPQFSEVDQDGNASISEEEFQQAASVMQAAGSAQTSFGQIDRNGNDAIDVEEYSTFTFQIGSSPSNDQTSGEVSDPASGTSGQAKVTVKEQPADVNVETKAPTVIVKQPEPEVTIDQPKPEVTVEQPKPDVAVEDHEPQVNVERSGEPQVKYQSQTAEGDALLQMTADDLAGKELFNTEGNEIGSINKVVASKDSNELAAVVDAGGVLGVGEKSFVIPLHNIKAEGDRLIWQSPATKDAVEAMDNYDAEAFADLEQTDRPLNSLIAH